MNGEAVKKTVRVGAKFVSILFVFIPLSLPGALKMQIPTLSILCAQIYKSFNLKMYSYQFLIRVVIKTKI